MWLAAGAGRRRAATCRQGGLSWRAGKGAACRATAGRPGPAGGGWCGREDRAGARLEQRSRSCWPVVLRAGTTGPIVPSQPPAQTSEEALAGGLAATTRRGRGKLQEAEGTKQPELNSCTGTQRPGQKEGKPIARSDRPGAGVKSQRRQRRNAAVPGVFVSPRGGAAADRSAGRELGPPLSAATSRCSEADLVAVGGGGAALGIARGRGDR